MGWKWKGAVEGLISGAKTGNPYAAIAGGTIGGFSQDIDKKVTGNSQSGMTQGLMSLGSSAYGGSSSSPFNFTGGAELPQGAGISMPGQGGWDSGGMSGGMADRGFINNDQIGQLFSAFQKQRNPADTTDPEYNPVEHAGLIKSRYSFIPDQTFQKWIRDNQSQGIQMGAQLRR